MNANDTFPAGPALDRLVAERVMGWERRPQLRAWYVGDQWKAGGGWSPSTRAGEAMAVADHVQSLGYHLRLCGPWTPGKPWFAGFTPHGTSGWNGRPDVECCGETAALAICRAALARIVLPDGTLPPQKEGGST